MINGTTVTRADVSQLLASRWHVGLEGGPWYLLSLFIWRLAVPSIKNLRYPCCLSLVLLVLCPSSSDSDSFAAVWNCTLHHLPFFTLGLMYPKILSRAVNCQPLLRLLASCVMCSAFLGFHSGALHFRPGGIVGFADIGQYCLSMTLVWCFTATCTATVSSGLATLGSHSFYAYVLHRVVLLPVGKLVRVEIFLSGMLSEGSASVFLACLALLSSVVLSVPAVEALSCILQPHWLEKGPVHAD